MHDVAIKVVEDEEELSSQENEDIDPEVQFLQRVRHKNVVWFFGFGSLPSPFLVFEYMDQGDLSKWLWGQKQESRAWVTRIRLLRDAAAGMAYLHEKQHSIHRDLKSGNILLARTWCGVRARSARINHLTFFVITRMSIKSRHSFFYITRIARTPKCTIDYYEKLNPHFALERRYETKWRIGCKDCRFWYGSNLETTQGRVRGHSINSSTAQYELVLERISIR